MCDSKSVSRRVWQEECGSKGRVWSEDCYKKSLQQGKTSAMASEILQQMNTMCSRKSVKILYSNNTSRNECIAMHPMTEGDKYKKWEQKWRNLFLPFSGKCYEYVAIFIVPVQ